MTTLEALRTHTDYHRFTPHHRPEEYVGQAGPYFGQALPPYVYDAIAEAKVTRRPNMYAVIGETRRDDGIRFLDFGVTGSWIEDNTNYRADERGHLRWTCPECGKLGGRHVKTCGYE